MGNYGFKDRQTAIKVKSMVETGSASGATVPGNVFDEQGGVAIYNSTGKTIPSFGLVFYGRSAASTSVGTADYPALPVNTYSQVKDQHNFRTWISDNWLFNNSAPVEPNQFGWAQAKDITVYGYDKGSGGVALGSRFRPSASNDFQIEPGAPAAGSPSWEAFSVRAASELGADDDVRAIQLTVPYGGGGTSTTIARAVYRSGDFDSGGLTSLFEITSVDTGNAAGVSVGDTVRVYSATNYPVRDGAMALIMSWGSSFNFPGGGFGNPATVYPWVLIDIQVLECENPDDDGTGTGGSG